MINKKLILPLFILLAIIQLLVPIKIIFDKEITLNEGIAYKFKTRPIDPNDPFRGKYITLSYDIETYKTKEKSDLKASQNVYVCIVENKKNGFAKISKISKHKPRDGEHYFKSKIKYIRNIDDTSIINLKFPFKKLFLEETKAKKAEILYNKSNRKSKANTYALVKINKGDAVLKDVYIGKRTVNEILNTSKKLKE